MLENDGQLRRITRSDELAIFLLAIYPGAFTLAGTDGFDRDGLQSASFLIKFNSDISRLRICSSSSATPVRRRR
jgi:hypothetical protein